MAEPTQRRAETRQRILAAAGDLFREHGIDGVGVDAVMKQAGLTHGGFYLHFPSKEALAAEVSQSLLEKAASKWDRISRSPDREAALEAIVRDYLDPERLASAHCCPLTTLGPDVARRSKLSASGRARPERHARCVDPVLPGRRQNGVGCAVHHGWRGRACPPCRRPGPVARHFFRPPPTAFFRTTALTRSKGHHRVTVATRWAAIRRPTQIAASKKAGLRVAKLLRRCSCGGRFRMPG